MPAIRRPFVLALLSVLYALPGHADTIEWVRQLGTIKYDGSTGVSTDGLGNIYISGYSFGSLGDPSVGHRDALLSKFSAAGNLLWTHQFGTTDNDGSFGVASDGLGNIYVSGETDGNLASLNAGNLDAFVSKFNSEGSLLWMRQIGSTGDDVSGAISADGLGNVYVSGDTDGSLGGPRVGWTDDYLLKYDSDGNLLWSHQFGTMYYTEDGRVSADKLGNVFVAGNTTGDLAEPNAGERDAFVGKYDASGNLEWIRQLGTRKDDECEAISTDGLGNVYISGGTEGSFDGPNAGDYDAFVSKYDASGNLLWTRQLGTSGKDISRAVSTDGLGNVYFSGAINSLSGGTLADAFVGKYDAEGNLLWLRQLGSAATDVSFGVSADGFGNVYFSGSTDGSLGGLNAGSQDAFIAKINDSTVPEPPALALSIIAIFAWSRYVNRRSS